MTLEPGLQAAFRHTVTGADTAAAIGSGEVPVPATPRVLALAERATVTAVAGALQAGATTVGTRVERHCCVGHDSARVATLLA
jgi:predicted thioesterase